MKSVKTYFAASIIALSLSCFGGQKTVDLFNGENLEGWKFFVENSAAKPGDVFSVKNGLIHIKGITLAIPYIGLRREFSGLESGRYPAL